MLISMWNVPVKYKLFYSEKWYRSNLQTSVKLNVSISVYQRRNEGQCTVCHRENSQCTIV